MTEEDLIRVYGVKNGRQLINYLRNLENSNSAVYNDRLLRIQRMIDKENGNITRDRKTRIAPLYTPRLVKAHLDKFVIGQESAKKVLSIAAYKHMLRYDAAYNNEESKPVKNNVILIGGTGTGKTYLCSVLSKFLDLPFGASDISRITQSGYHGGSIDSVTASIEHSIPAGVPQLKKMHSIVLLDEIDKICEKGLSSSKVSTVSVQYELLKLIEGMPAQSVGRSDDVLFIGAGSFGGEVVENKTDEKKSMGFNNTEEIKAIPINDQLVEYGMIPELVGRFQSGSTLETLSRDDLVNIMIKSKESVMVNFIELFKSDKIKLSFTRGALELIADKAIEKGTGARSLNSTLEQVLSDVQFNRLGGHDKTDIKVDKKFVEEMI